MPNKLDAAIIGAGAAGLAAAKELRASGYKVEILEARTRFGGRILTQHDDRLPIPIELGAEFLHGKAETTNEIAKRENLVVCEVSGSHWRANNGKLTRTDDYWEKMGQVMGKMSDKRLRDRSFQDFLDTKPGGPSKARERALAREFVQGFHATDVARISEKALASGGVPGENTEEDRMGRLIGGYSQIPQILARGIEENIRLGTVVTKITWSPGDVCIESRSPSGSKLPDIYARSVIITVPLGVLHAEPGEHGAIQFVPEIEEHKDAASLMAMGSVVRLTLLLSEPIWETGAIKPPKGEELTDLSFLHARDCCMPVWWTQFPVRASILVGWSGGPPAAELLKKPAETVKRETVSSLARQVGMQPNKLEKMVLGHWMYNWDADPFSRGAYSYPLVGGANAAKKLSKPVEDTIFFAGEATDYEAGSGTVHGAIATGQRAASRIKKSK